MLDFHSYYPNTSDINSVTLLIYFHIFNFKEKEALGYVWYDVVGMGFDIIPLGFSIVMNHVVISIHLFGCKIAIDGLEFRINIL